MPYGRNQERSAKGLENQAFQALLRGTCRTPSC